MTRFATLTILVILVPITAAAAQDRAADALIERGLELRREDKPAEALEMFRRAQALAPSARTLGQMGLAETTLEQWIEAEGHLTASVASVEDAWVRKNRTLLEQALAMTRSHIGELAFTGPAGTTITVAGRTVGVLPSVPPVRLGEGNVLVSASAPGFKQFIESVHVQAGNQVSVSIALDPIDVRTVPDASSTATQATSPITQLDAHYSWKTWTAGTLIGTGVGVLTWGIVWIAIDGHRSGDACAASVTAPCKSVYNTRTPGWILAGTGAAATVGGGFLLYAATSNGSDVTVGLGPTSLLLGGHF